MRTHAQAKTYHITIPNLVCSESVPLLGALGKPDPCRPWAHHRSYRGGSGRVERATALWRHVSHGRCIPANATQSVEWLQLCLPHRMQPQLQSRVSCHTGLASCAILFDSNGTAQYRILYVPNIWYYCMYQTRSHWVASMCLRCVHEHGM